jgi:hypothetical protein
MVHSGVSLMLEISVHMGKIRFRVTHTAGVYTLCNVGAIVPHNRPRRHSNNGICLRPRYGRHPGQASGTVPGH